VAPYPLTNSPTTLDWSPRRFGGFNISGTIADAPIVAVFVDPNSNVTGLIDSAASFSDD
jgi:hypothetical protein